jgi:tetratricopeptide (TPR) repeat protein
VSDERDSVEIMLTTKIGEQETIKLIETTVHSGDFTGAFTLAANENPVANNLKADDPIIETNFGDVISVTYNDQRSADSVDPLALTTEIPVVVGTNGLVAAFSKAFNDEELAVETKFRIAESYFELFKSHKEIGRDEEQLVDLESGRRILQEVMEDYPDPKYVPRISYLLGQFSQELGQWSQAIASYEVILQQYADHTLAPDAQFKMAQCYEESGDFNEALEAYVTLAATFPKSPLIASVMIRISDHFYKAENYVIAAQVGEKFLEKFEAHEHAQRMAFRVGQAYYKNEEFKRAAESFDQFTKCHSLGMLVSFKFLQELFTNLSGNHVIFSFIEMIRNANHHTSNQRALRKRCCQCDIGFKCFVEVPGFLVALSHFELCVRSECMISVLLKYHFVRRNGLTPLP